MPRRLLVAIAAGGLLLLVLGAIVAVRCGSPPEVTFPEPPPEVVPSGPPAVRFVGRFDHGDSAGPRFAWSGSMIHARFRGTQLSLRMRDTGPNTYTVVLDKLPPRKFVTNAQLQLHTLATALSSGEHDVTIVKNTEPDVGEGQFLGFDFGPGGELLPPRARTRRIEFIGDSITCGYGIDGTGATCASVSETENQYTSYSGITARALGADAIVIAWSARGLARNADGSTTGTIPALYGRTLPQYEWSQWDFRAWVPDAVVVNLGTNDFAQGDPGEALFVPAYVALLETIRKAYAGAQIFCVVGPMFSDETPKGANELSHARAYVSGAVKARKQAGDALVTFVEFAELDAKREGLGCNEHPGARTHRRMAAELSRLIKKTLSW